MEYMAIAYALIAVAVIGYVISLSQRWQAVKRERVLFESKSD